jgi:predicted component of type VI protein secretion system
MLPLVITVGHADGGTRRYAFAESPVSIGRSPFAELQLSEAFISRWEGTLRFDAEEITYFSLGTTNATRIDGAAISAQEEDIVLHVDSVLALGELELRFARERVPEADLRRKGKRRPQRDDPGVAVKTVYLDGADAWKKFVPPELAAREIARRLPQPSAADAHERPERPEPSRDGVTGQPQPTGHSVSTAPPSAASTPPEPTSTPARRATLQPLLTTYRETRQALLAEVRAQLSELPETEHRKWLERLERAAPELAFDPDLQTERERVGLAAPLEIPELRAWLRAIGRDVLPDDLHFDSRQTLTRLLGLIEALVQSLAEIHDAQDSVRQRWLGRSTKKSVLQSDKGHLVLAYLLNPQADWSERLRELEQSIRELVTHELALFKATLEGARALVDTLAPERIAEAEAAETEPRTPSWWSQLRGDNALEARLWRQLTSTHAALLDGQRYERVFLGRFFARSYLAAMGQ